MSSWTSVAVWMNSTTAAYRTARSPGVAGQARGHQEHGGPHPLAAGILDVAADLGNQVDVRFDMAGELALDLLEVLTYRLEDLREGHSWSVHGVQSPFITPYLRAECQRADARSQASHSACGARSSAEHACEIGGHHRVQFQASHLPQPGEGCPRFGRRRPARCGGRARAPAPGTGSRSRPAAGRPGCAPRRRGSSAAPGNVMIPENDRRNPSARASSASRAVPLKQWNTPPTSPPPSSRMMATVSSSASRVWMTTGRPDLACQPDLGPEDLALHVARRQVVMVVEADLAERRRARRPPRAPPSRPERPQPPGRRTRGPGAGERRRRSESPGHKAATRRPRSASSALRTPERRAPPDTPASCARRTTSTRSSAYAASARWQ